MAGNSFGRIFRVMTWGESHGPALGAVIDGCPPGIALSEADIQTDLERRRPGKKLTTARKEPDRVRILSGVFEGLTTGTPISLMIENTDVRSRDYEALKDLYRPGHADRTYEQKYGLRDWRGGGRSSGRETVARVAAGAVARKFLAQEGIHVRAGTIALGTVRCEPTDWQEVLNNPVFCPNPEAAKAMEEHLKEVKAAGDSIGGVVLVVASGCPAGLGEPVFDKLDARLASALMSIGAVKGVEIGAGFRAASMLGSLHNDPPTAQGYASNNAGGVLGGISTGMDLVVKVAVKPIPSVALPQKTVTRDGSETTVRIEGRHDVSAIPRIVPVCEAMVLLTLADFMLHPYPYRLRYHS